MKRLKSIILGSVLLGSIGAFAFNTTFQQEPDKKEISASKLPEEARFDITDNYHGAKIIKVYLLSVNGKTTGYLVTAQKGEHTWDLKYDMKGNPLNKVNP